jgi:hypothetical protein
VPVSSTVAHHRARIAALSRDRRPNDPELVEARRSLRAESLALHVAKTLSEWPELTAEQIQRVAALLRAGGGDNDAA